MVKRIVNLPNVTGWAGAVAGAFSAHTVTLDLPVGPRYHVVWISGHAGAGKKATDLIGEIRIKVNGAVQRVFTLTELLKLNVLNSNQTVGYGYAGRNGNVAATTFYIPIWFAEPWRKSLAAQDGLAWGTGDVSTFQIELDIAAYAAGTFTGLVAPTFKAEVDNSLVAIDGRNVDQPLGIITKWRRLQIPITSANGWNDFLGLKDLSGAIQSVHLSDANISEFELIVDNSIVRKNTTAWNAATLAARDMAPDAASTNDCPARAMYDLVFDHDDILANALPLTFNGRKVGSVNLRLNENGGTVSRNITTLVQYAGPAE